MDIAVKDFFRMLHEEYLKPRGYRKVGHNFYRRLDDYAERFQFQGSAWIQAGYSWRFYVNVGVEFRGLRTRKDMGFPRTHCHSRLEAIVTRAPPHFDFQLGRSEPLARRLSRFLEAASETIARKQSRWRASYKKSKSRYAEMR
jgi:hypothetical protein